MVTTTMMVMNMTRRRKAPRGEGDFEVFSVQLTCSHLWAMVIYGLTFVGSLPYPNALPEGGLIARTSFSFFSAFFKPVASSFGGILKCTGRLCQVSINPHAPHKQKILDSLIFVFVLFGWRDWNWNLGLGVIIYRTPAPAPARC